MSNDAADISAYFLLDLRSFYPKRGGLTFHREMGFRNFLLFCAAKKQPNGKSLFSLF